MKRPNRDADRLVHMREATEQAIQFMRGRTREDLDSDLMLVYAVRKAIEIIGEAAFQMTEDGRDVITAIPWPKVIAMRHHLVHGYDVVNLDVLWKTVQEDLPKLHAQLTSAIAHQPQRPNEGSAS